jgi:phage protein D
MPEQTFSLVGVKAQIKAVIWLGAKVTHLVTDSALTTRLELQSTLPDDKLYSDDENYSGVYAWYRDDTGKERKITAGDQTNPKRLTHLYVNEKHAQTAVDREWKKQQKAV